jgi:beta-phosphoglucomutase-like phosphatase (HAD superfamily)
MGAFGYLGATALTAALLLRLQVRNTSSSFAPTATSLSYAGVEGFAADATPDPQSFFEQSKRGSKRGSKRAWTRDWDKQRTRVSVAWLDDEPRTNFDRPTDFFDAEQTGEDSDLGSERVHNDIANFDRPTDFFDAEQTGEDSDLGSERERHGFNPPVDFQEEAGVSALPETADDDLDLPNVPNYWPSFAPSEFDPVPAPRGPLAREKELDPQVLDITYQARGAQRFKNIRSPQRAVGMIFELEVLVPYTELYCTLWNEVAIQHNLPPVTADEVNRAMTHLSVDGPIKEFQWTFDREIAHGLLMEFQDRLKSAVQDKTRIAAFAEASVGATAWLNIVKEEKINAAIVGHHSGAVLRDLADAAGLADFATVSVEDNLYSLEQAFLNASVKIEMAPSECCTFVTSPRSVMAAHDALMKGVSVSGVHPRYELTVSDLIIDSFEDLNFEKVRMAMSANVLPDYQLEPEPELELDRFNPR